MVDTIFLSLALTRIATMEKTPDASTPLDIKIEGNKADLVSEPQTFPIYMALLDSWDRWA
jgi:hypothetical protein